MNHPNRDWKLPLPSSFFEERSGGPAPLPTPPAAPHAIQATDTPVELTNPTLRPFAVPQEPPKALERRGERLRWWVLVGLVLVNILATLMLAARR
jgi:hypothetical protein